MTRMNHAWTVSLTALLLCLAAAVIVPTVQPASNPLEWAHVHPALPNTARFQAGEITIGPDVLPTGQINVPYSATLTAEGGNGEYTFSLSGQFPTELNFDTNTGTISGTVSGVGTVNFDVIVTDTAGNSGTRSYTLAFTETGAPPAGAAPPQGEQTIITAADIEATRVANLRLALGVPRVFISEEVDGLAIRTGPFVGASLRNIAQPGQEYNIIGQFRPPGSRFTWYLIEYEVVFNFIDPDAEPLVRQGWVSGRFATAKGYLPDIEQLSNPFDAVATAPTGITGLSVLKSNIYRYPAGSSPLVSRFDEGTTFQILGRTVLDRRDITYWILVRLDSTGQVGWTRYTPFIRIDGDLNALPTY